MSIFNTGSPSAGSGGKVAPSMNSGTDSYVSSMSFTVDAQPTKWLLLCAGPFNGSGYYNSTSTSRYLILGAYYDGTSITGTTARAGSSGAATRIYNGAYLSQSYNNGTLTLTGDTSRYFMNFGSTATIKYYLLYNTN